MAYMFAVKSGKKREPSRSWISRSLELAFSRLDENAGIPSKMLIHFATPSFFSGDQQLALQKQTAFLLRAQVASPDGPNPPQERIVTAMLDSYEQGSPEQKAELIDLNKAIFAKLYLIRGQHRLGRGADNAEDARSDFICARDLGLSGVAINIRICDLIQAQKNAVLSQMIASVEAVVAEMNAISVAKTNSSICMRLIPLVLQSISACGEASADASDHQRIGSVFEKLHILGINYLEQFKSDTSEEIFTEIMENFLYVSRQLQILQLKHDWANIIIKEEKLFSDNPKVVGRANLALAQCYDKGPHYDPKKMVGFYFKAIEFGLAEAAHDLALTYVDKVDMDQFFAEQAEKLHGANYLKENIYQKAVNAYDRAIELGFIQSTINLVILLIERDDIVYPAEKINNLLRQNVGLTDRPDAHLDVVSLILKEKIPSPDPLMATRFWWLMGWLERKNTDCLNNLLLSYFDDKSLPGFDLDIANKLISSHGKYLPDKGVAIKQQFFMAQLGWLSSTAGIAALFATAIASRESNRQILQSCEHALEAVPASAAPEKIFPTQKAAIGKILESASPLMSTSAVAFNRAEIASVISRLGYAFKKRPNVTRYVLDNPIIAERLMHLLKVATFYIYDFSPDEWVKIIEGATHLNMSAKHIQALGDCLHVFYQAIILKLDNFSLEQLNKIVLSLKRVSLEPFYFDLYIKHCLLHFFERIIVSANLKGETKKNYLLNILYTYVLLENEIETPAVIDKLLPVFQLIIKNLENLAAKRILYHPHDIIKLRMILRYFEKVEIIDQQDKRKKIKERMNDFLAKLPVYSQKEEKTDASDDDVAMDAMISVDMANNPFAVLKIIELPPEVETICPSQLQQNVYFFMKDHFEGSIANEVLHPVIGLPVDIIFEGIVVQVDGPSHDEHAPDRNLCVANHKTKLNSILLKPCLRVGYRDWVKLASDDERCAYLENLFTAAQLSKPCRKSRALSPGSRA